MDWNKFVREVHQTAVENGLWDKPVSFDDIICECLVHLGRAYEEHRSGRPNYYHLCAASGDKRNPCEWDLQKPCPLATGGLACEHRDGKPHGVVVELADCVLRLMDYLASNNERIIPFERIGVWVDLPKVICDLCGELDEARNCNRLSRSTAAEGHMHLCIEIICGWADREGIYLGSILRELHEYDKARAGRREGATP